MNDTQPPTAADRSIREKILCAIDTPDLARARGLAAQLPGRIGGIKLGLEFFSAHGPDGVREVMAEAGDARLFLDLKFHDIPNTVAAAMRAAVALAPGLINVHAGGGPAMLEAAMKAAQDAAEATGIAPPLVLGVTVLTSLDGADLEAMGVHNQVEDQVVRLAELAARAGLDGVVCSAREITAIRRALGPDFVLVTPGIRPASAESGDQKRVTTPADALSAGADYLVIGRPITADPDPAAAADRIVAEAAAELA